MSNKKQTAVDILFEQLNAECMRSFDSNMYRYFLSKIEQAKEIEKEQMKEMYLKGIENYDPIFKRTYEK
jgi:hypothetical protein